MPYKHQGSTVEASKQKLRKEEHDDSDTESIEGNIIVTTDTSITLIHDYINKR